MLAGFSLEWPFAKDTRSAIGSMMVRMSLNERLSSSRRCIYAVGGEIHCNHSTLLFSGQNPPLGLFAYYLPLAPFQGLLRTGGMVLKTSVTWVGGTLESRDICRAVRKAV